MTPDDAIKLVNSKARGRTRYEGQEPRLDEVLVGEIERLTNEIKRLRVLLLGVLYADEDAISEARALFPNEGSKSAVGDE